MECTDERSGDSLGGRRGNKHLLSHMCCSAQRARKREECEPLCNRQPGTKRREGCTCKPRNQWTQHEAAHILDLSSFVLLLLWLLFLSFLFLQIRKMLPPQSFYYFCFCRDRLPHFDVIFQTLKRWKIQKSCLAVHPGFTVITLFLFPIPIMLLNSGIATILFMFENPVLKLMLVSTSSQIWHKQQQHDKTYLSQTRISVREAASCFPDSIQSISKPPVPRVLRDVRSVADGQIQKCMFSLFARKWMCQS